MASPIVDREKIVKLKRLLRSSPRTIADLQERLGVTTATVYRWIKVVEKEIPGMVVRVGSDRPAKFRIVKG